MNGGDKAKTEFFKSITTAYQTLVTHLGETREAYATPDTKRENGMRPLRQNISRSGVTPPRHMYNVAAWNEAHYGGTPVSSNQYSSTENYIRSHAANSSVNTNNSFMRGMETNKTFQHTQRM